MLYELHQTNFRLYNLKFHTNKEANLVLLLRKKYWQTRIILFVYWSRKNPSNTGICGEIK